MQGLAQREQVVFVLFFILQNTEHTHLQHSLLNGKVAGIVAVVSPLISLLLD